MGDGHTAPQGWHRARNVTQARYTMRGEFHTPPPQFDGCFTAFYHFTLDVADGGTVTDHLLPEWGTLRFFAGSRPSAQISTSSMSGARFGATGPSSRPCRFELGSARMWGIGLLPVGWARFVEADAHDLANTAWDGAQHPAFARFNVLSRVLTDPEASVQEQYDHMVEQLTRLMRPCRDEGKIRRVHEAIVASRCASVSELAGHCGMSVRTLERLCQRYFGFAPKLLMRRQRFMRSLTSFMLHKGSRWTDVIDAEYHDQAQFTREFREFMNMLPSEFAALDHPIIGALTEARVRHWGSAAQALDPPGAPAPEDRAPRSTR